MGYVGYVTCSSFFFRGSCVLGSKNGGEKTRMPSVLSTGTSKQKFFSASTKFLQKHDTYSYYRKIHRIEQRFVVFQRKHGHHRTILREKEKHADHGSCTSQNGKSSHLSGCVDAIGGTVSGFQAWPTWFASPMGTALSDLHPLHEVKQCIYWSWKPIEIYIDLYYWPWMELSITCHSVGS